MLSIKTRKWVIATCVFVCVCIICILCLLYPNQVIRKMQHSWAKQGTGELRQMTGKAKLNITQSAQETVKIKQKTTVETYRLDKHKARINRLGESLLYFVVHAF